MEDKMRDIIFESAKECIKNCSNARIQEINNMNIAEMFKYMLINNISIKRDMYCLLLTILQDSKMI
jgi:hypothetical protein